MNTFKPILSALTLLLCLLFLAACFHDETTECISPGNMGKVDLLIGNPSQQERAARLPGDPGTPHSESAEWDRMVILTAYTATPEGGKLLHVKSLSKSDYEGLPSYNGNAAYRLLSLDLPIGQIYLYGLTYTSGVSGTKEIEQQLKNLEAIKVPTDLKSAIEAMTISNDYARQKADGQTNPHHIAQMLGVASGFYADPLSPSSPLVPTKLNVQQANSGGPGSKITSMTLSRLATKVDTQWDALDAYEQGIQDVRVEQVAFIGEKTQVPATQGSTTVSAGRGRLFPTLNAGKELLTGNAVFLNQSPISKRNGRVYHYLFPDGVCIPRIAFSISGTDATGQTVSPKEYTFKLSPQPEGRPIPPLLPGAWYKVNCAIKGFGGQTDITVSLPAGVTK